MKEALWYEKAAGGRVRCLLCPHQCLIQDRRRGICEVRDNRDGVLYTLNYHLFSSVSIGSLSGRPRRGAAPSQFRSQDLQIGPVR